MRPYKLTIGILLMTLFMSCSDTTTIEDIAGSWEGNVTFFNNSHAEYLQLQLNEQYEYRLNGINMDNNLISTGEFRLQKGNIVLIPSVVHDTNQIAMLMYLNNRPVKVLNKDEIQGLQIKMNNVWHFLQKTN
ncbi:MAG: hypothetical protein GVY19_12345 [Bacteroidetes bacterium]|jgi:hypothetical protein|nr:hypothetical protein [Bacteroidota bacterium]